MPARSLLALAPVLALLFHGAVAAPLPLPLKPHARAQFRHLRTAPGPRTRDLSSDLSTGLTSALSLDVPGVLDSAGAAASDLGLSPVAAALGAATTLAAGVSATVAGLTASLGVEIDLLTPTALLCAKVDAEFTGVLYNLDCACVGADGVLLEVEALANVAGLEAWLTAEINALGSTFTYPAFSWPICDGSGGYNCTAGTDSDGSCTNSTDNTFHRGPQYLQHTHPASFSPASTPASSVAAYTAPSTAFTSYAAPSATSTDTYYPFSLFNIPTASAPTPSSAYTPAQTYTPAPSATADTETSYTSTATVTQINYVTSSPTGGDFYPFDNFYTGGGGEPTATITATATATETDWDTETVSVPTTVYVQQITVTMTQTTTATDTTTVTDTTTYTASDCGPTAAASNDGGGFGGVPIGLYNVPSSAATITPAPTYSYASSSPTYSASSTTTSAVPSATACPPGQQWDDLLDLCAEVCVAGLCVNATAIVGSVGDVVSGVVSAVGGVASAANGVTGGAVGGVVSAVDGATGGLLGGLGL